MTTYRQFSHKPQGNACAVEYLTEEQIVSPQEEVELFWSRLPENPSKRHTVRAIADEWLTGCYDAKTACYWIRVLNVHRLPVATEPYEAMATIARREFGSVALPEPPVNSIRERNKAEGRAA